MEKNYRITIEPLTEEAKAHEKTEVYECISFALGAVFDQGGGVTNGISFFAGQAAGSAVRVLVSGLPNGIKAAILAQIIGEVEDEGDRT